MPKRPPITPKVPDQRGNRADCDKLHPPSHLQSHPQSHCPPSKCLILLTKPETYDPPMGSGKGSGVKRGATLPKSFGFRTRQVFLRHTRRIGSLPSNLSSSGRRSAAVRARAVEPLAAAVQDGGEDNAGAAQGRRRRDPSVTSPATPLQNVEPPRSCTERVDRGHTCPH